MKNELLGSNNLVVVYRSSKKVHQPFFVSLADFKRTEATRYIPKNATIRPQMISRQYLVKSGNKVNIIAQSGQLYVRMPGIADESGMVGDVIKVKNARSGRIIVATVVDEVTVRVQ